MSKRSHILPTTPQQARFTVDVNNYNVSSLILNDQRLWNIPTANQPETRTILQFTNLPFQLSQVLEKRVIRAMTDQDEYQRLLTTLI